jgi:hypothetical protein
MPSLRRRVAVERKRLRAEQALLVVLALHAAFLCLFRVHPYRQPSRVSDEEPACTFVAPAGEGLAWEEEMHAWAELEDPALLSLPDETHGFARFRKGELVLPCHEVPAFGYQLTLEPEQGFSRLSLSAALPGFPDEIGRTWASSPPQLPAEAPFGRLPVGFVWRLPDGTVLADMPKFRDEEVRAAMAATMPTEATRVDVSRDLRNVRVRVQRSCGNRDLDMMVVRQLTRALAGLDRKPELKKSEGVGLCFPDPGASSLVEVEWRKPPVESGG